MTGSHSTEPAFLSVEQVRDLHDSEAKLTGERLGVLDENGLEAAVHAPQHAWAYTGCGLFVLAATYLYHIARGHPFVAANKRTAYLSAITFLDMNGLIIERSPAMLRETTLAVAQGKLGTEGVERALRRAAGYPTGTDD